jgi:23S rRNA (uridine2552-2'-O)-methyltransferase
MSDQRGKKGGPRSPRASARNKSATGKKATGTRFISRTMTEKVKTAKGRKGSSTRWLQRQLNDPYVAEARARGYRSRAAFKLLELDDKFHILKPGKRIVDLGAAPGGWTQVIVERVKPSLSADNDEVNQIIALDINEMEEVPGAKILLQDFLEPEAPDILKAAMNGPADVVLSDMAAPSTGHPATDHMRIMNLCELALEFAEEVLAPGGVFLAKVLHGGTEHQLLARMKKSFKTVKHAKPPASRSDSAEMYVIAQGFRGSAQNKKGGE